MVQKIDSNGTQVNDNQEEFINENERKKYEEEKKSLSKQIDELRQFINEAELTLHSVKYGDIQIKNKAELFNYSEFRTSSSSSKVVIPNVNMEYELYKMAGLYCTKSTNNEFVFNVSARSNDENSSAVQFFIEDDKITLGHWVMPIGITIDYIIAETPLEIPIHVIPFLRNCKRHVLCYEQRKQQFDQLNKCLAETTNCQITANFGYLTIVIVLFQVTNKQTDQKLNLTINLFYSSGKVRPHTLKINWDLSNSLSEELSSQLRSYTKRFKKDILQDAYNFIINQSHAVFEWKPKINTEEELALEINQTVLENNEDSENDSGSNHNVKKRKRVQKQHTKPVEEKIINSTNSENSSDDSAEHLKNESVTKSVPKKKSVTRQASKKLRVIKKTIKPSKTVQPKVSKTKGIENVPVNSATTQKQDTRKEITAKSSEKKTNMSTINTPSKQTELNFKDSKVMKRLEGNKKYTYSSTPMLGHVKRTKQLTLNLSPIVSETITTAKAKGTNVRRSLRKKK